jgi:hypothetical protein
MKMTKTSISLQDLRRRIYVKAKAEKLLTFEKGFCKNVNTTK